ncbi:MAG: DUF1501 domain-containing protein [Polyangiales bacterium]
MNRRSFLRALSAGAAAMAPWRDALACDGPASPVLWVHVQGGGGWDQALFCDPKPSVRMNVPAADREVRRAGNIPYLAFADLGAPAAQGFFARNHARMLVINGVDTATNNHQTGQTYSSSGASVPEYPCWGAQVAAVYGCGKPMPFLSFGGYDRAGGMLAPARVPLESARLMYHLGHPSTDTDGRPFLADSSVALVEAAHRRRLQRLRERLRLPGQRAGIDALIDARATQAGIAMLEFPGYDASASFQVQEFRVALSAFRAGLTSSVATEVGRFDTHTDNEAGQRTALGDLFTLLTAMMDLSDAASVPCVVLATSDFGRTPHYTGSGTDHHPVSSVMILQSAAARAMNLGLPVDRVIGASTDGGPTRALRPVRVNPSSFAPDDAGVVITPGHVLRAMRRAARIASAPRLAAFPLAVGRDLALGA